MPQSLHAELARAADREEVSLNQFITSSLASAVGWRRDDPSGPDTEDRGEEPRGGVRTALIVNLVILAIVAIVAVILLIVALSQ
jgi:hypothetical protein